MASSLPEEVTTDILTRLPVKSLLRFRSVSKRFRSVIDSPHFIKRHLTHSLTTKSNRKLLLRGRAFGAPPSSAKLYSASLDQLDQALEINHPGGTEILGSVNGIVCLQNDVKGENDIVLWNFATGKYRKVPASRIEFSGLGRGSAPVLTVAYGFGYDELSDDYKLFRLVHFYGNDFDSFNSEAKVYSLRSNSWHRIQDFPYYIHYGRRIGVLACGALHWAVSHTHGPHISKLIAGIDLATNECRVVDYPEFLEKGPLNVIELEGCLCVPCFSHDKVEVWVMKDYGVKESWSKLYSVPQPEVLRPFEFVVPLTYSKSGTEVMLLQDNVKLLWYNLTEGMVRRIHLRGCPDDFLPEVCVESLVPLSRKAEEQTKSGNGAKEQTKSGNGAKEQTNGGTSRKEFLSQGFKLKL